MLGRWTTVDLIHAGVNWYVYVNNDPVNRIDPLGLSSELNRKRFIDRVGDFLTAPIPPVVDKIMGFVPGYYSVGRSVTAFQEGKTGKGLLHFGAAVAEDVMYVVTGKMLTEIAVGIANKVATRGTSGLANVATKGVTGYRYMAKGEIKAIQETGMLRGGRPGETFFTKDLYKAASKAQSRLSLPSSPTYRVEFEILNNPTLIRKGTKVASAFGQFGKGAEFMTLDPIKVNIINIQPLR